jgi:hypothetical protein
MVLSTGTANLGENGSIYIGTGALPCLASGALDLSSGQTILATVVRILLNSGGASGGRAGAVITASSGNSGSGGRLVLSAGTT